MSPKSPEEFISSPPSDFEKSDTPKQKAIKEKIRELDIDGVEALNLSHEDLDMYIKVDGGTIPEDFKTYQEEVIKDAQSTKKLDSFNFMKWLIRRIEKISKNIKEEPKDSGESKLTEDFK